MKFNLILLTSILLYSSCCSIRGTSVKHYYFKSEQTADFINQQPDSVVFIDQQNNIHYFNQVAYGTYIDTKNECHQCCEDNEIEKKGLFYTSTPSELSFEINLYADKNVDYFYISYNPNYRISSNSTYYNDRFSYVSFKTQVDSIYNKTSTVVKYIDSLRLINKVFRDVFVFEKNVNTTKVYPEKVYYTTSKGIVGIRYSDGDVWELKE